MIFRGLCRLGAVMVLVVLPFAEARPFGPLEQPVQVFPQGVAQEIDLSRLNADLDLKLSQYVRMRQDAAIAKGRQLKQAIHDIAFRPVKPSLVGRLKLFFGFGGAPKSAPKLTATKTQLLPTFLKRGALRAMPLTEEARLASEIRGLIAQAFGRVPVDASVRSPNELSSAVLKHLAHAQNAAFLLETAPLGVDYFGGHNDLILRGSTSGLIDFPIVRFLEAMVDGDAATALRSLSDMSELMIFSSGEDALKADLGWAIPMTETLQTLEASGKKIYAMQLWNLSLPVSLHMADMAGAFTKKPASAILFMLKDGNAFFGEEGGYLLRGFLEGGGSSLNPEKFGGWLFDPSRGSLSKRMGAGMWDFLDRFLVHAGTGSEMCTLWEKNSFGRCPVGCNNQGSPLAMDADAAAAIRGGTALSSSDLGARSGSFAGAVPSGGDALAGGVWGERKVCGQGAEQGGGGGIAQSQCNGRLLTSSGRGRFSIVPEEDRIMQAVLASVRGGSVVTFRPGDMAFMKSPMCRMKVSLQGGGDETGGSSGGETTGSGGGETAGSGSGGETTTEDTTPEETVRTEVDGLDETVTSDAGIAAVAGLVRAVVESILPTGRGHDLGRGREYGILRATIAYLQGGHVRVSSTSDSYEYGYTISRDPSGNEIVVIDQDTADSEPAHIQEVLLAATAALSISLGVADADGGRISDSFTMARGREISDYVFDYRRGGEGYQCASESASCGPECSFMETQLNRFIEYISDPPTSPLQRGCDQGAIYCEGEMDNEGAMVGTCMPAMSLDPLGVCAQASVDCEGGSAVRAGSSLAFLSGMDFNQCCSGVGGAGGRGATVVPGTGFGSPLLNPCRLARGGRCGDVELPGQGTVPGGPGVVPGGGGPDY